MLSYRGEAQSPRTHKGVNEENGRSHGLQRVEGQGHPNARHLRPPKPKEAYPEDAEGIKAGLQETKKHA